MFIIVGLGNPGKNYEHTRHNAGFDVLTLLADKWSIPINKIKHKSLMGEGGFAGQKVALVKPQTFMNLSGEAVVQLVQWYKITPPQLIVVYDDIDLQAGRLRVRPSGSAGTHNGMRSIIQLTGWDGFPRVRVGVGRPDMPQMDLKDYVLGRYPKDQQKMMFDTFLRACGAVETIIQSGCDQAMMEYNHAK